MIFGQLMEYNMRDIFIENHIKNVVEKLVSDYFLKRQNRTYFRINILKLCSLFLLYVK